MSTKVLSIWIALAVSASAQSWTLRERFGVPHADQPVHLPRTGAALTYSSFRMIGPEGVEVPWQPVSDGRVLVRTHLPASRRTWFLRLDTTAGTDTVRINLVNQTRSQPENGDVIIFASTAPGGTSLNTPYYLKNKTNNIDYNLSTLADLSDTVDLTNSLTNVPFYRPGFIVSGSDLYALSHGYATGNAIQVATNGTLPSGLAAATTYYAINVSANLFKLATTRANALAGTAIATSGGSGQHETIINWTWTLEAGTPTATPVAPVVRTINGDNHEITNGNIGVRVATTASNGTPFQRAAIQGVRLSDGTWAANGPNRLYLSGTSTLVNYLTGYTATVTEDGPLMQQIRAVHTFNRPSDVTYGPPYPITGANPLDNTVSVSMASDAGAYKNGATTMSFTGSGTPPCGLSKNTLYWMSGTWDSATATFHVQLKANKHDTSVIDITCLPSGTLNMQETWALAGTGTWTETITVYAGGKSVVIETDAQDQFQYFLNLRGGSFLPDEARWRGHYATSAACGAREDSTINGVSATQTFGYSDSKYILPATGNPSPSCGTGLIRYAPNWSLGTSGVDTGYYWLMYQNGATGTTPLAGYITGRASRTLMLVQNGPGIYTSPSHFADSQQAAGISMFTYFRSPSAETTSRARREWMIYSAPISEMTGQMATQPASLERNGLAAVRLTSLASMELEFSDPAGGWPPPFAERTNYDTIVNSIQTDSAYRSAFLADAPELSELVDMWMDPTPTATEYTLSRAELYLATFAANMQRGDGPSAWQWSGYSAYLNYNPFFARLYAILNYGPATAAQKARAKAALAWAAHVIWDPDYAPLDVDPATGMDTGEGLGNANQVLQFVAYRAIQGEALAVGNIHSQMSAPARRAIVEATANNLFGYILPDPDGGAPKGSTWYYGAAMDPALSLALMRRNAGASLAGLTSSLTKFGQWMADALTPLEPRFGLGTIRKHVSTGDGNTASISVPGLLATVLRGTDATAANRAQWAWASQNSATARTLGQFTAPSILVIDRNATTATPPLVSRHYRGYWSVLRHGAGTANETACWFTNGSLYVDHRQNDPGQTTCYAHNAPLFLDWNANLYSPQTQGGFSHSRVVFTNDLTHKWDTDNPPINTTASAVRPADAKFSGLPNGTLSETEFTGTSGGSNGTIWTRSVMVVALDPAHPLILVRDRFTGTASGQGKVVTWNMAATGDVTGDWGTYSPTVRLQTTATGTPTVFPSNGPLVDFTTIQRLRFTGTSWSKHASGGIDWDAYLIPSGRWSGFIGNWGHSANTTREMGEFNTANSQTFREQQHILRLRGTGEFASLFAPFVKGGAPASRTVTQEPCGVQVVQPSQTVCVSTRGYVGFTSSATYIGSFNGSAISSSDATILQGPAEVKIEASAFMISLAGAAGRRAAQIPDTWSTPSGWTRSGQVISIDFGGTAASYTGTK